MPAPFSASEYATRLEKTRSAMRERDLDAMLIGDPANINWLSGYDAWSFYTPQTMVVTLNDGPYWLGRAMDAGAASVSSILKPDQLVPFPEHLVQKPGTHPGEYMGEWMRDHGLGDANIGYESDVYYLSPKCLASIQAQVPGATWTDADLLVNWARVVKSEAEIGMMRQAAQIAGVVMQQAYDLTAQIRGTPEFGGDMPALHPLVLAGEAAATAHPMWTDAPFESDQTIAYELGGCRKRYNAGLARTMHLGKAPARLTDTAKAVNEGMQAVVDSLKADVHCSDVHAAWQKVLDRYGLKKESRIGYSIGVGYSPDWGEHTLSFRPGESDTVPEDATIHIILGMWMDGWGMEVSETIHVREKDAVCLTDFPREVFEVG